MVNQVKLLVLAAKHVRKEGSSMNEVLSLQKFSDNSVDEGESYWTWTIIWTVPPTTLP
jgi:hypothetical protein